MGDKSNPEGSLARMIKAILIIVSLVLVFSAMILIGPNQLTRWFKTDEVTPITTNNTDSVVWIAPDLSRIPKDENGKLIEYGRALIVQTSQYLGPKGSVKRISNGMNCQNCHLDGGTKPFGNNYSAVASTYPKFRARSGTEETIEKRVNDCIERSLNGMALENDSREMKAIIAYIKWLGSDVEKGVAPKGSGLLALDLLDRPASIENGKIVYQGKCMICHGVNGEGIARSDGSGYQYPPLWGKESYNMGAGLFRLSRFAGYVKANMPFGASYRSPQLTDEEAWDVAAFVNSLPRPEKDLSQDWPDISKKPFDHPFGPYSDGFDEVQHKFGPFEPIEMKRKAIATKKL